MPKYDFNKVALHLTKIGELDNIGKMITQRRKMLHITGGKCYI